MIAMESNTSPSNLSTISQQILRKRILLCDEQGNPLETAEEMFWRVAWEIAKVERQFSHSAEVRQAARSFAGMMQALEFLPNSPTLMNAGLPNGQLSACFVRPLEDSMESIFRTLRDMALIQKSGGGTGFSFSHLRPRGDAVGPTRGTSSGPVSFMKLFDYACETTRSGGARRGANMGVMRFDHPDILEFVTAKTQPDTLRTFNISVAASDSFVDLVRRNADYPR